jgi:hypothetical protein
LTRRCHLGKKSHNLVKRRPPTAETVPQEEPTSQQDPNIVQEQGDPDIVREPSQSRDDPAGSIDNEERIATFLKTDHIITTSPTSPIIISSCGWLNWPNLLPIWVLSGMVSVQLQIVNIQNCSSLHITTECLFYITCSLLTILHSKNFNIISYI